ncbi:hypothetical protein CmeUKMEL1_02640 [Cryptosporidium meleagridis]|uniref:Uncharacterized protein n=1 Tax=Cryptosporidium meleagridis TaxID=93969 RepID=A0A2P4YXE1_9CRYT|nr:hypothetical protein CmeUKMEL1_02640 [Cryptosporidium meleagridis]
MKSSKYQEFESLPNSLLFEKKSKSQLLRKNDLLANIVQDNLDDRDKLFNGDHDVNNFDDLPFVIPSKRIVIEWPIHLLKNFKAFDFENDFSKYELENIEICKVLPNSVREKGNQVHQKEEPVQVQEHEKEEPVQVQKCEKQLTIQKSQLNAQKHQPGQIKSPANLRLKYMQIYIMGGYAKKHFHDKEQNSYNIRVEIRKNQEIQAIKVINISEKDDMHFFTHGDNILSSFQSNNFEYHLKFISSQIQANKRMFRFNSRQYKLQIFKFLNLKIPIKCDDQIYLCLGNRQSKHESNDVQQNHQIHRRSAILSITKQNLLKLAKDGGFQALLELHDHFYTFQNNITQQSSTHSFLSPNFNHPDTFIGYILLSIQKA